MSGVGARRGFAFQDMLLADRLLRHASRTRAGIIEGVACAPEPEFGVEASAALSGEEGPEWDLLERGPHGVLSLEEVKSGRMDVGDRRTLWLRVRAQFQKASPDERERLRICLSVNSEKPPQALPSWNELGAWVNDPANEEVIAQFSSSPVPTTRAADVPALAQEAIHWLTTGPSDVAPLDSGDALRLLRRFRLSLESESEVRDRVRRQLEELSQGLAIDQLMDCIRGAISRHAEGPRQWRVFRPSQLLEGIDVLKRLQTVDAHEAALWRDIETWGRTVFGQAEPLDPVLAYVGWRRVQPDVSSAVDMGEPVALLGRGGLGKSTALQHYLAELAAADGDEADSASVLLLDAAQLASCLTPSSSQGATGGDGSNLTLLRGALSLGAFVARTRGQRLAVGVDAVEALGELGRIQTLLSSLLAASGRDIRVLVTCRATTWNELKRSQQAVHGWHVAELTDWAPEVVVGVVEAQLGPPAIRQLAPSLLALLRTPLFLDLFLRTTGEGEGFRRVVSSRRELLAAYWQRRILPSGDARSLARGQLLRDVSQRTMEGSEHHHLPTAASSDMSSALRDLASEGLFVILDGSFQFRHALLRDFAIAQSVTETSSPLQQLCGISSHFVRLGALEFWIESEMPAKGGFARLRQELDQIQPGALVDVASSLGQLENVGSVGLLELTAGMQPGNVQRLMVQATRWARLAGNDGWMLAVVSLPAHSEWAEATPWIERELIEELLDLVADATSSARQPASTRRLAETIREWLDAPRFALELAEYNDWLQGHAFSVIGGAAPSDDTLRWFIRRGRTANGARGRITATLPEIASYPDVSLTPELLAKACLTGAGLRWSGRRLEWDDTGGQNWMGIRPYLLGESVRGRWPGWLATHPEAFVPIAVALIAGFEWSELESFEKRREPELDALLAELEETDPTPDPTELEAKALELARNSPTAECDEPDIVPQLMPSVWLAAPHGPLGLIEWVKERASKSLSADGQFFDDVLWPAVRDGASLACRVAVLDILTPNAGPSPRPGAMVTLLHQPALYRSPDAHAHLQRGIRQYWPTVDSPAAARLLACIMFSSRRHGWENPDIYAPGPLLFAIPDDSRPEHLEPFLQLYGAAGFSLELAARARAHSSTSEQRPRRRRTTSFRDLAPSAREGWKRLLDLPDATMRSSSPEHQSETLAALRGVLSKLPSARELIGVEGAARRLQDVVHHLTQGRAPQEWPLTSTEVQALLDWAFHGVQTFSEQELQEGCQALERGSAQLPPMAEVWIFVVDIVDTLLRALPSDVERHQTFFELLDARLRSPPDALAHWAFFHVHGWFRADGAGKALLKALLGDRVRSGAALWLGVSHIGGLDKSEQRTLLDTWLSADLEPPLRAPNDFLRQLGQSVGGDALIPYEDGTHTASHDVLLELLERRPTVGLLSNVELHAAFLNHCVFGAKEAVVGGAVPNASCWLYGGIMMRAWRALHGLAKDNPALSPMSWIFLPLFDTSHDRRAFRPSVAEWRQWWTALLPLANAVLEAGSAQDVHCLLKALTESGTTEYMAPSELLELLELFRKRSRDLTRGDFRVVQWWYQTFDAACDVAEQVCRGALDSRSRHQVLDILHEWAGPPLSLPRAAQSMHVVRSALWG